jgi:hypothetical protein
MIGGRSHASKVAKIVNQVGLIGVAVVCGNQAPINASGRENRTHDPLQPTYAGKAFRSNAHLLAKTSYECLGQESHTRPCLGYRRAALEHGDGICNCTVPRTDHVVTEHGVEHAELGCWRRGLTQALAKHATIASPKVVELNDLVTSLADGHTQECRRSTELEFHSDQPTLLSCINRGGSSVRARQHSAAGAMDGSAIWTAVRPKLVLIQIDHQVRLTCGEYPLHSRRKRALVVVKGRNEWL